MGWLVGVGLYLLLWRAVLREGVALDATSFSRAYAVWTPSFVLMWTLQLFTIGLSLIGIWAASRAERLMGKKDPSQVVIDEVAGQLVTFMFVPAYFLHPLMIFI